MVNKDVQDHENLLRLTFAPEHFVGGEFQPTAVSLADLRERGFSVDRTSITTKDVVMQRVEDQSARAPAKREVPVYSLLQCGEVRAEADEHRPLFDVEASPMDDNPGHASIYSSDRTLTDSQLRRLRIRLIALMEGSLVTLDGAFAESP